MLDLNGEADHGHLLLALPSNAVLSIFVNLKTTSSRLLREEFADEVKPVYRNLFWPGPAALSRAVGTDVDSESNTSSNRTIHSKGGALAKVR